MSIVLVLTQILMAYESAANCQTKAPQISGIINWLRWNRIPTTLLIKKDLRKKAIVTITKKYNLK
jgi:hypothetical protein